MRKNIFRKILSVFLVLVVMLGTSFAPLAATSDVQVINDVHDPVFSSLLTVKYEEKNSENDFLKNFSDDLFTGTISSDGKTLDWVSKTNVIVRYVFVKGADGGNLYSYNKDGTLTIVTSDTGLVSPEKNGNTPAISHVTFYYEKKVNVETGAIQINKTLVNGDESPIPHEGVTFILYKDGVEFKTGVTNQVGLLEFKDLAPGIYELSEDVDAEYNSDLADKTDVTVVAGGTKIINVVNTLKEVVVETGTIQINKTIGSGDGSVPHAGVTFILYKDGVEFKTGKTNEAGKLEFTDLAPGIYELSEDVDAKYNSDLAEKTDVTVVVGETEIINVVNTLKDIKVDPGTIRINKTLGSDAVPLEGVIFILYKGGVQFDTGATDKNGILEFKDLEPGTYELSEQVEPIYNSSLEDKTDVDVISNQTTIVDVLNTLKEVEVITGAIEVLKTIDREDGEPQSGVTFNLYKDGNLISSGVTNGAGKLKFNELIPGEYKLEEVVPEGYESSLVGLATVNVIGKETVTVRVVNKEVVDIPEEEIPLGPIIIPEDDDVIIIEEEETPLGGAELPKTGAVSTTMFTGAGIALLLAGALLKKKK